MLSVVIATKDSEEALAHTLASLVSAAADGTVREVIVADGGSSDGTLKVADSTGCRIVAAGGGVGDRLRAGADVATRGEWLMFIAPGVLLDPGWDDEFRLFADRLVRRRAGPQAAVFRYAVDDIGIAAGLREWTTRLVCRLCGVLHPDQPLLVPTALYRASGGYRAGGALSAIEFSRRLGTGRIRRLRHGASRVAADGERSRLIFRDGSLRGRLISALLIFRVPLPLVRRLAR